MFYHVITSIGCNLSCKYCDKEEFGEPDEETYDYKVPCKINYDLEKLKTFVKKEDYVTFYGGEPLLGMDDIRKIMDSVECQGFMIQTNGLLLHELGAEYVNKFHTILVSIDGDEEITDKYRGVGVHSKVMENVKLIREQGFTGELIARMVITSDSDVYVQVKWLLENGFDNIHWQLDAMFSDLEEMKWLEKYNADVVKLMDFWIDEMKNGKVLRLYPFLVVMDSILKNERSLLRCGSGHNNFTIVTNGKIAPCPIMSLMKKNYLGDIDSGYKKTFVNWRCLACLDYDLCGGRCLYSNILYSNLESYEKLCKTTHLYLQALKERSEIVKDLISKKIISLDDFKHLKYNGVEVIP